MEIEPAQEKVNFVNAAGDNNEVAYNNLELFLFVLAILIISAFGLAIFVPLFCLARIRKLLLSTGASHFGRNIRQPINR